MSSTRSCVAFAALLLLFPFTSTQSNALETVDSDWQINTVGAGTKPAIDFAPDGRLHVMGMIEAISGYVWHASSTLR